MSAPFEIGQPVLPRWAWTGLAAVIIAVGLVLAVIITRPAIAELPSHVLPDEEWVNLERLEFGQEKRLERDIGNWDIAVADVEWNVTDLPPDLVDPPSHATYMTVTIHARDWSLTDSTAWVAFHFDYLTDTGRMYPEATCYDGCLPTAPSNYLGEYEGKIYFLVPEGTRGGFLMVDSLVSTDEDFLLALDPETSLGQ